MIPLEAISVIQPWAWLLLRPDVVGVEARAAARAAGLIKDVENRDWHSSDRGWVLLHASASRFSVADWTAAALFAAKQRVDVPHKHSLPYGAIVGAIRIDGCEPHVRSPWFVGRWGFVVGEAAAFPSPVPYKGALKFFPVPGAGAGAGGLEVIEAVAEQIRAAGLAEEFKL